MKKALVVCYTEVVSVRPKLIVKAKTICFNDIDKGRKFVQTNAYRVSSTELVERGD